MLNAKWEDICDGERHQYVMKNMQETCINKYLLSDKFYKSHEEAVEDVEHEGLFRVWCRFEDPGFIKREDRKESFCTTRIGGK